MTSLSSRSLLATNRIYSGQTVRTTPHGGSRGSKQGSTDPKARPLKFLVYEVSTWTQRATRLPASTAADVLEASTELLRERFGIAHATIQVESRDAAHCSGADW